MARTRTAPAPQLAAPTLALVVDPALAAVRATIGLPAGAITVTLERTATATGHRAFVRGVYQHNVAGLATLVVYDYEAPLGVELLYTATATDASSASATAQAGPITIADQRDWLVDLARPTNTMPIAVQSLPELSYAGPTGVHRVLERRDPVLTTSTLWTPTGTLTFTTSTRGERDRARAILGAGVTALLRTPPSRGVGNLYFGIEELAEQRPSRLAAHDHRRFVVGLVQVARPDPELFSPSPPLTYARRLELWATYRAVVALGVSYQELAYTDGGGGTASPGGLPWLPDDI
jgi:hypothetical protein